MPEIDEKIVLASFNVNHNSIFESIVEVFTYDWYGKSPFVVVHDTTWMKGAGELDGEKVSSGLNHYICENKQQSFVMLTQDQAIAVARKILEYYGEC